jgi:hypothetical protein
MQPHQAEPSKPEIVEPTTIAKPVEASRLAPDLATPNDEIPPPEVAPKPEAMPLDRPTLRELLHGATDLNSMLASFRDEMARAGGSHDSGTHQSLYSDLFQTLSLLQRLNVGVVSLQVGHFRQLLESMKPAERATLMALLQSQFGITTFQNLNLEFIVNNAIEHGPQTILDFLTMLSHFQNLNTVKITSAVVQLNELMSELEFAKLTATAQDALCHTLIAMVGLTNTSANVTNIRDQLRAGNFKAITLSHCLLAQLQNTKGTSNFAEFIGGVAAFQNLDYLRIRYQINELKNVFRMMDSLPENSPGYEEAQSTLKQLLKSLGLQDMQLKYLKNLSDNGILTLLISSSDNLASLTSTLMVIQNCEVSKYEQGVYFQRKRARLMAKLTAVALGLLILYALGAAPAAKYLGNDGVVGMLFGPLQGLRQSPPLSAWEGLWRTASPVAMNVSSAVSAGDSDAASLVSDDPSPRRIMIRIAATPEHPIRRIPRLPPNRLIGRRLMRNHLERPSHRCPPWERSHPDNHLRLSMLRIPSDDVGGRLAHCGQRSIPYNGSANLDGPVWTHRRSGVSRARKRQCQTPPHHRRARVRFAPGAAQRR